MTGTNELHDLVAPYALDALEPLERARFEAHLDTCEACFEELIGFAATAARLGEAHAETPSTDLRDRILAQAASTPQERVLRTTMPPRWRRALPRLAVAAALLLGVAGVGGYVVEHQRVSEERDQNVAISRVLGAADAETSTKSFSNGGTVRLLTSREQDAAVVVARSLPSPGEGKVYQVWMVSKDVPTSQGTFTTSGTMLMKGVSSADALAVTVEPDGGSEHPTSDPVVTIPV